MPCYSYTSANPVLYTNVINTQTIAGTVYSYSTLALICEFPVDDQLQVFKKNSTTNTEVQLVYTTDFTINTTNETITVSSSLVNYDQIVIKRITLSDKMIYRFNDGAKLTAKQLNDCFHQLLFVTQEKGYLTSTVNVNYPVSVAISAWNSGTTYGVGEIISYNNKIYKSIIASNTNNLPTNTASWSVINPQLNSFVITGNQNTVEFDLLNLSLNYTLVWNGSKFVAGPVVSTISSLTDVDIAPVNNNDVLIYDTSNGSKWTAKSPSFSIIETNLKFADYTFYNQVRSTSYFNPSNQNITLTGPAVSAMSGFKDTNNRWVLTDAPTVYHILKNTIPNGTDPISFFSTVRTELDLANQNLTNPIKLKFYWNLNHNRQNINDSTVNLGNIRKDGITDYKDNLGNFKTAFWHKPEELYTTAGYDISTPSPLLKHGVTVTGSPNITYYSSPYFTYNSTDVASTFKSKLEGYGIKAFYLSVPECKVTHINLPVIFNSGGTYVFTQLTNLAASQSALSVALSTPGNEWNTEDSSITVENGVKDYYLMGLRDMAFAAARPKSSQTYNYIGDNSNTTAPRGKVSNHIARWQKGKDIGVWYSTRLGATLSQWRNIPYKRLETTDTSLPVLWKIPDQIIYFNKLALADSLSLSEEDVYDLTMDSPGSVTQTGARAKLRFTGYHRLQINANANSSTSQNIEGLYYKANSFWQEFQQRWTEDTASNEYFKFNEADIDWYFYNVSEPSTTPKVYRSAIDNPPFTAWNQNNTANNASLIAFPWVFRPNDIKTGIGQSTAVSNIAAIGTGFYNIDANKLFSEADQFIEDPCDEFVYRIVSKPSVVNYLKQTGVKHLKSSIILEHGFSDLPQSNGNSEVTTTLQTQYQNVAIEPTTKRAWSRLFESKIKIYIKDEKIEQIDSVNYYVITLVIRIPRLKSIGYSKIYRKYTSSIDNPPEYATSSSDTNAELGPWTYNLSPVVTSTLSIADWLPSVSPGYGVNEVDLFKQTLSGTSITSQSLGFLAGSGSTFGTATAQFYPSAMGRNEAAVKFTSIGLPSNLWIRLSVLNTDGTTALIDGTSTYSGFTSTTFSN
jgi:hypothetical protein